MTLEVLPPLLCWFISTGQRCSTMLWLLVLKVVQLCQAEPPSAPGSLVNDVRLKTALPYGNNLPPPLRLFSFVSPTNAMASSRGKAGWWMSGWLRWNQPVDVRNFWTSTPTRTSPDKQQRQTVLKEHKLGCWVTRGSWWTADTAASTLHFCWNYLSRIEIFPRGQTVKSCSRPNKSGGAEPPLKASR